MVKMGQGFVCFTVRSLASLASHHNMLQIDSDRSSSAGQPAMVHVTLILNRSCSAGQPTMVQCRAAREGSHPIKCELFIVWSLLAGCACPTGCFSSLYKHGAAFSPSHPSASACLVC